MRKTSGCPHEAKPFLHRPVFKTRIVRIKIRRNVENHINPAVLSDEDLRTLEEAREMIVYLASDKKPHWPDSVDTHKVLRINSFLTEKLPAHAFSGPAHELLIATGMSVGEAVGRLMSADIPIEATSSSH